MRHDTSVSLKVTGRLLLSCGRQTEKVCRPNSVLFWWKTVDLAGDDCTWHLLYDTVVVVIVWLVRWPMLLFLWERSVHVSSVPNDRRCKVGVDCLEPVVTWLARWPVQSLGSWTRLSSTNLYCAKGCKQIGGTVLQWITVITITITGGSVAEWLACWTQVQKVPGSNRSCDAVG